MALSIVYSKNGVTPDLEINVAPASSDPTQQGTMTECVSDNRMILRREPPASEYDKISGGFKRLLRSFSKAHCE